MRRDPCPAGCLVHGGRREHDGACWWFGWSNPRSTGRATDAALRAIADALTLPLSRRHPGPWRVEPAQAGRPRPQTLRRGGRSGRRIGAAVRIGRLTGSDSGHGGPHRNPGRGVATPTAAPLTGSGAIRRDGHPTDCVTGWYVQTCTPVLVVTQVSRRNGRAAPSSGKIRFPPPSTTGSIIRTSSSTSLADSRVLTREALPQTSRSPPSPSRRAAMSSMAPVRDRSEVFSHVRSPGSNVLERDVLLDGVHPVGIRVAGPLGPCRGHPLPGAPAEQQCVRPVHGSADRRTHHLRVEVGHGPAPMGEASVPVLVRAPRGLHDAVQAHETR